MYGRIKLYTCDKVLQFLVLHGFWDFCLFKVLMPMLLCSYFVMENGRWERWGAMKETGPWCR